MSVGVATQSKLGICKERVPPDRNGPGNQNKQLQISLSGRHRVRQLGGPLNFGQTALALALEPKTCSVPFKNIMAKVIASHTVLGVDRHAGERWANGSCASLVIGPNDEL